MKAVERFSHYVNRIPLICVYFEKDHGTAEHVPAVNEAVLDYAEALNLSLSKYFKIKPPIRCVSEFWKTIFSYIPSVIVLSDTLKEIDALKLIMSINSCTYISGIRFVICSKTVTETLKSFVGKYNIDAVFSMSDPCDEVASALNAAYSSIDPSNEKRFLDAVVNSMEKGLILNDKSLDERDSETILEAILLPLGFDGKQKGTKYLHMLLTMLVFSENRVLKSYYSSIASVFRTTPAAVEKAIRYSIETAFARSIPYMQYKLFGYTVDAAKGKPTNSEFVATILQHIMDAIRY